MGKLFDLLQAATGEVSLFSRFGEFLKELATSTDQNTEQIAQTNAVAQQFAAGEVPVSRTLTAGAGLQGGGDLSANRTFNVGQNVDSSIVINPDDVQVNPAIQAGAGAGATAVQPSRTLTAGSGLTGGGDLSADRSFAVSGAIQAGAAAGATAVQPTRTLTAGAGLTGGGDLSANRTFNTGQNADSSIIINADDIQLNTGYGLYPFRTTAMAQVTWFIDPVGGNDANTGLTSGTAIKTDAERQRRVGTIWTITADTSVTYLNNVPDTDPVLMTVIMGKNGVLRINGVATTTYTSPAGGFTAVTNLNRAAQQPSLITEVGLGAGRTGQRIRTTSGASTNSITWLDKDLGAGQYRTSPWGIMSFAANPLPFSPTPNNVAIGNQFVIESLTQIAFLSLNVISAQFGGAASTNGTQIVFQNLYFTQSDVQIQQLPTGTVTFAPLLYGCRIHAPWSAACCQTYLDTGVIYVVPQASTAYFGCLVRGRMTIQSGATIFVDFDTLFSQTSNGVRVRYLGVLVVGTMAAIDNTSDGVLIEDGDYRSKVLFSGAELTWGNGNTGVGININSNGFGGYVAKPTLTGGGGDTKIGGIVKTYAQIPFFNGYDGVTVGTGNGARLVLQA